MVRCGRCQTQFDVPGEGRFACPTCGAVNEVRAAPDQSGGDLTTPRPVPPPPTSGPAPKTRCPDCDFEFIVGDIETAICPNCSAEVPVRGQEAAS